MLVVRSVDPRWLSNAWLVAPGPGTDAVVIDAGAPPGPLLGAAREHALRIRLVLLTHHHGDHVVERAAFGAPVAIHALERGLVPGCDRDVADGDHVVLGALRLRVLHVPGHTRGQINVLADLQGEVAHAFTGDTLFRGSVGGTRGPGHGTFVELRHSILDRLLALPDETAVHPGHGDDTTIGRERAENPFVRAWRGDDATLDEPCRALDRPATLLTWGIDYDGGHKAWIRWEDGSHDTVPGSRVERRG